MIKIPQQLANDNFRFIKIKSGTKIPLEKRWKKECNYRWNELGFALTYLRTANSYGIICSFDDLVIIDCDTRILQQIVENNLPSTFTVKAKRGFHYYYIIPNLYNSIKKTKISLRTPETDKPFGDLILNHYVIAPDSCHYDENANVDGKYEVVNDVEITTISTEKLNQALLPFSIFSDTPKREKFIESEQLDIIDILQYNSINIAEFTKNNDDYRGSHPVHDSESGNNFTFNTKSQMWHCWRHNTWGDNLSLIALLEGIITCEELQKNNSRLTGEKYHKAIKIATEKYGLKKKYVVTERIQILRAIRKLKCDKEKCSIKEILQELDLTYNKKNSTRIGIIINQELRLQTKSTYKGSIIEFQINDRRLYNLFSRYRTYNNIQ
ncbi:MAG: bifunctional DNA primase/polymerase [Thermoplasmatales archaeon]|nr:bifunctional DNA primase/polymerase [Thermoplasmatales archaeon]